MAVQICDLNFTLDINKPNVQIDQNNLSFKQGNPLANLLFRLTQDRQEVQLPADCKPIVYFLYYSGTAILRTVAIEPTLADGSANPAYTITVANNIIKIPNNLALPGVVDSLALYGYAGKVGLVIQVSDNVKYYTYSCYYNVDRNPVYDNKDIISNLPSTEDLTNKVAALTQQVNQMNSSITAVQTGLNNNAAKDLSNVADFSTVADGSILYKNGNKLSEAPMKVDNQNKVINSSYDLKVPANSLALGENITLHENGGYVEYSTKTLGKSYLLVDYENDHTTGTQRPQVGLRGALNDSTGAPIVIFSQVDQIMTISDTIDLGFPAFDRQVQNIYLKTAGVITNLKIALNINGHDVAYYPADSWDNANVPGFNLPLGTAKIALKPFFTALKSYNIRLRVKADTPIKLLGDGTHAYLAEDLNRITFEDIAYKSEINGGTGSIPDDVALNTPVNQCWVSTIGSDNNAGSISSPFKTIQKALDSTFGLINVLPGTFTEDINVPVGYGQYGPVISGAGTYESPKSEIQGTITIPVSVSRVRFKNIQLDGKGTGPAIIDNGSDGRHVLENVTVSHPATNGDSIRIVNGKNWWNVEGSTIEGAINLSGTGNNMVFSITNSPGSLLCTPIVNNGYTFIAFYVGKIGLITHLGGNVFCNYVGVWAPTNSKIINSTSTNPVDFIGVAYSTFTADTINFGTIASNGATVVKNFNVESLYSDVCLSAVSTVASTLITTTASTLIAGTKKVERNISYNTTTGELTFVRSGSYSISTAIKIDCTEWNKKVELWIEKYNTSNSTWEVVADTGFQQNFTTGQESAPHYSFVGYFTAGEKYRLRAISDSDTTIAAKTLTLTNGVKMPAIRISVHG